MTDAAVGNRGVGNLRLIGLVVLGLGPASRVFIFHLLDSLLTATTNILYAPYDLVFQQQRQHQTVLPFRSTTRQHLSKHAGIDMPIKGRGPSHQRRRRGGSRRSRRSSGRGAGHESNGGDARGATGDIHPSETGRLREHAATYHVGGGGVGTAMPPTLAHDLHSHHNNAATEGAHILSRKLCKHGKVRIADLMPRQGQKGMLGRGKEERKEGKGAKVKGLISTTSH
jgi:hypothetical protein